MYRRRETYTKNYKMVGGEGLNKDREEDGSIQESRQEVMWEGVIQVNSCLIQGLSSLFWKNMACKNQLSTEKGLRDQRGEIPS